MHFIHMLLYEMLYRKCTTVSMHVHVMYTQGSWDPLNTTLRFCMEVVHLQHKQHMSRHEQSHMCLGCKTDLLMKFGGFDIPQIKLGCWILHKYQIFFWHILKIEGWKRGEGNSTHSNFLSMFYHRNSQILCPKGNFALPLWFKGLLVSVGNSVRIKMVPPATDRRSNPTFLLLL